MKTLSAMALRSGVCKPILGSQVQTLQRFYNSWNAKIEKSVKPERLLVFDVRSMVAALLNYTTVGKYLTAVWPLSLFYLPGTVGDLFASFWA